MDWNLVMSFVRVELVLLVIFLYCLGLFLKKVPAFRQEWLIPIILLGVSVVTTVVYSAFVLGDGFTPTSVISSIIQGVIIASLAVFGNEIFKQAKIKRVDDNKPMKGGR